MPSPLIAIVGAPNVGKSTLFNRLTGRRRAIVTDEPGVTRDRLYGTVRDRERPFRVVDTGGLTPLTEAPYAREIERQAELALDEAALILFVVDARAGVHALDEELARMLRKRGRPLLLVANKVDSDKVESTVNELHRLGLGDPLPISAEHGRGIERLEETIEGILLAMPEREFDDEPAAEDEHAPISVALVGRPNVGKSSILNRLVGQERVLVSDLPGTTRDAIDTMLELGERRYRLIDTAGIRRPGRVRHRAERFSVQRAKENIARADVTVLVLDASQEIAAQDTHIAGYVVETYRPLVVVLNKWDLVSEREENAKQWEERVRHRLRFAKEVSTVFVSAKTGQRVVRILDRVDEVYRSAGIRVSTPELNQWLQQHRAGSRSAPPPRDSLRLFYITQKGIHPPSFVLFCNDPRRLHFSVRRQIENGLRERFSLGAAPIRLEFRGRRKAP